ncbi:right-handed parallel beta-helix repeat-containing protein [Cellulomonas sp. URHE0023]|uniref:right-handed parallel beta-helix repeat-containing protein n=1 Tax=Cellulomonas sp. URHE0023 TaxID=1380354 RepID=UPI000AE453DB|nr:right-handed parallel beta-helix repeat-containing protein [Cellulomonas sp. URHE0023]
MRVPAIISCLALASAAVLVAAPATAAPVQPTCGSTLTEDTALQADLTCAGPGLILGIGVDLDLNGHTLRGTAGGVGLAVLGQGTESITNGTVTGWDTAVRTVVVFEGPGVGPLLVDRVRFRNNGTGIDGTGDGGVGAKDMTISNSTFTNHSRVAVSAELIRVDVDHTNFSDNTVGYWGDTGSLATVTDSRFVRDARAVIVTEASATIERSSFVDNPKAVVGGGVVSSIVITDSRLVGSDVAVNGTGAVSTITGSTFVSNSTAVQVGQFGGTISSNTFRANQTTVALAEELGTGVAVQDNTFRLNGDGLHLETAGALLSVGGNNARNNTGWGINVPGATDLGGNTAKHNGNQPQCVGVVCS